MTSVAGPKQPVWGQGGGPEGDSLTRSFPGTENQPDGAEISRALCAPQGWDGHGDGMLQACLPSGHLMELCQPAGKPQRGHDRCDARCHPREVAHVGTSITPAPLSLPPSPVGVTEGVLAVKMLPVYQTAQIKACREGLVDRQLVPDLLPWVRGGFPALGQCWEI